MIADFDPGRLLSCCATGTISAGRGLAAKSKAPVKLFRKAASRALSGATPQFCPSMKFRALV